MLLLQSAAHACCSSQRFILNEHSKFADWSGAVLRCLLSLNQKAHSNDHHSRLQSCFLRLVHNASIAYTAGAYTRHKADLLWVVLSPVGQTLQTFSQSEPTVNEQSGHAFYLRSALR